MKNNFPKIIKGGVHTDTIGKLKFVNDFDFLTYKIRRFYCVINNNIEVIRACQAHKYESKFFFVTSGKIMVQVVKIDDWELPSNNLEVQKYSLTENDNSILFIPSGYANGFKSLTSNSSLMVFSDRTLEESESDDFRFDKYMWSDWRV